MRDYTLRAYQRYLLAIKVAYPLIMRFDQFLQAEPKPERFCIIRHDVDRKPGNALKMAQLERSVGLSASYYFRNRRSVFSAEVIHEVHSLGHEVGYHYESLSDCSGDMTRATRDFEFHLERFRKIVPVGTISMHGRPFSKFDNRDLWRSPERRRLLRQRYELLGEIYLDIDYREIAYIADTGRNWSPGRANLRDRVATDVLVDLRDGQALVEALFAGKFPRLVFQIHPERWTDRPFEWLAQWLFDQAANSAKKVIDLTRGSAFS